MRRIRGRTACIALGVGVAAGMWAASALASAASLRIYAPNWEDYTEPDGSGFGWAVVRAVYEPTPVRVKNLTAPYKRAVSMVRSGEADAWLGSYINEKPDVLYPDWHYDADRVSAVMPAEAAESWSGVQSLRNARVSWIPGYAMGKYFDVPIRAREPVPDRKSAFRMLARGRLDYFLGAKLEIKHALADLNGRLDRADFAVRHAFNRKLYPAFANNERGRRFKRIWDRRLRKLLESGRLAQLYKKHNMKVWPFDKPAPRTAQRTN